MCLNLFDFVAAHSQQTAEFIKGDYDGGLAELFVCSGNNPCYLHFALAWQKFAYHETPCWWADPTKARLDSTSTSFLLPTEREKLSYHYAMQSRKFVF